MIKKRQAEDMGCRHCSYAKINLLRFPFLPFIRYQNTGSAASLTHVNAHISEISCWEVHPSTEVKENFSEDQDQINKRK